MKIKSVFAALAIGLLALVASSSYGASNAASPANDRKIEEAAKASYNYRTVLEERVTVKATNGAVTLTGTVPDQSAKDLAADTVENLPTVVSVDNQIKIEPTYPEHSDAWMAFKIRGLLLVKANVSAINTKVVVTNGNVVLSGTADNIGQKELTAAYAKDVDGVKTVRNDLVIKAPPAGAVSNDPVDDASITSQVRYALLTHQSTSAIKTKVSTVNGVVRVTGDAASAAEKSLVSKLAMDVRGVKSVTNDMTVKI